MRKELELISNPTAQITLPAVFRGVISQQQVDRLIMNYIVIEEVIQTNKTYICPHNCFTSISILCDRI